MTAVYEHVHVVSPEEIDGHGHVNNVHFFFWMQTAGVRHSTANGWPPSRYREVGHGWFARHNEIDYLRQVFLGDEIVVRTWIASSTKATSLRRYALWRRSDRKLVATGKTDWAFVNLATGRPQKILLELLACFQEIPGDEPLAEFLTPRPSEESTASDAG